jgi:predicted kinase
VQQATCRLADARHHALCTFATAISRSGAAGSAPHEMLRGRPLWTAARFIARYACARAIAGRTSPGAPARRERMPPSLILLVTGPACTGKTTLAGALAERFGLPLFTMDGFKERMYDAASPDGDHGDRISLEFSRLLGRFAMECLEVALEACVRVGTHAVFEANFDRAVFSPRLARLREHHAIHVVQVALRCRGDVLLERFIARARTDRHPGHGGLRHLDAMRGALLRGEDDPLVLQPGDDRFEIDTTDLAAVDTGPLYACISQRIASLAG